MKKIIKILKNKKLMSKKQQRFKSKKHNVFTKEINKVALSSEDDKRTQPIESIETYPHGTSKEKI